MVHGTSHDLVYKIEFINPVGSSFEVKKYIQIFNKQELENHDKICDKYYEISQKINLDKISFLELNNNPNKYNIIRYIYTADTYKQLFAENKLNDIIDAHIEKNKLDFEETVHKLELFLEEFKLFVNNLKLEKSEQNIINSIIHNPLSSSNIKFIGWKEIINYF